VFLGHFAAALGASRLEPRLRLGTAFLACQLPDALWPYLLLGGAERVAIAPGDTAVTPLRFEWYPWSHSLVTVTALGAVLGLVVARRDRGARRAGALFAALVVSHWLLDAWSHRPDMPLWPGGPLVGLGLWNSRLATVLVEGALFAAGVVFYARGRRPVTAFWSLVATLCAIYAANLLGPPPPSVVAIAIPMIAIVPLLYYWGNRADASARRRGI
jgi:hypothetical protein